MDSIADAVKYRSLSGDTYDAVVTAAGAPGFVDLDVIVPGCADRVPLRGVRLADEPETACAWRPR